jgi:hypothetical protein
MPGMPAKLRGIVQNTKPEITIHLNSKRRIYSTMDSIDGSVFIKPAIDTEFDEVEIDFIGTSRTFVERYTTAAAISGRSEAYHNFLRLNQPRLDALYPEERSERTLKAGETYEYPFNFKVPRELLERICKHKVTNDTVKRAHLQLPPSLGDKELSSKDGTLDDMAPEMASVRYGIFVRITKLAGDDSKSTHVAAKARRVRVVPAVEEAPPLDVKGMVEDDIKTEYCIRKEKKLKKGLFLGGNLGTLVMEAAEPESARLPPANSELGYTAVNTMATVMLRFEPAKGVKSPPRLDKLHSKLKTRTYYATSARHDFPRKSDSEFDASRSVHGHSIDLISHSMGNFEWRLEDPEKRNPSPIRRDSTVSVEEKRWIPGPSTTYTAGSKFWTARLPLPITLPNTKHSFVPTFHSCLISRTYTLALSLSLQTAGLGGSIDLRVPMQISAAPPIDNSDTARRRESVASAQLNTDIEDDITSFFAPRSLANPSAESQQQPRDFLPPHVRQAALERSSTLDSPPPGYTDREPRNTATGPTLHDGLRTPTLPVR